MSLLDNMPHEASLGRYSAQGSPDGLGAPVETFALLSATSIEKSCWVQNAGQRDLLQFGKRTGQLTHVVMFPEDVDLKIGQVVRVTKDDSGSFLGLDLVVRWYTERTAGFGLMFKAFCEEEHNRRDD